MASAIKCTTIIQVLCALGSQTFPYMTNSTSPAVNQLQLHNTSVLKPPAQHDGAANVFFSMHLVSGRFSLTHTSLKLISGSKQNQIVQQQHYSRQL